MERHIRNLLDFFQSLLPIQRNEHFNIAVNSASGSCFQPHTVKSPIIRLIHSTISVKPAVCHFGWSNKISGNTAHPRMRLLSNRKNNNDNGLMTVRLMTRVTSM